MKRTAFLLSLLYFMTSCSPQPQPIEYGSDGCAFCRMNIVDPQYAAELVTTKGKVYKFDAIECMVSYLEKNPTTEFEYHLVNCYDQPKLLQNVEEVVFLQSKELASPMGAYLTAFSNEEEARKMQEDKGGKQYSWSTLLEHYKENENTFSF